jgi:carbonic anhydrase
LAVAPREALRLLMEGNRRFCDDPSGEGWAFQGPRLGELAAGQQPFASVLGCSDSRVPVEVVFGQGPGQLFVVRVAGNVVAPTQLGSIEFAVRQLDVRLVMVLGHSGCGAVDATLQGGVSGAPDYLRALTSRIESGIAQAMAEPADTTGARLERAVRLNVESSRRQLLEDEELARLHASGHLWVASAVYHIATGEVELLNDGSPETADASASTTTAR